MLQCGAMLKPFLPQLQTTFVKALNDPNRSVRLKAASALSKLIIIHTRVDPLFTELMTGVKNADDTGIRSFSPDYLNVTKLICRRKHLIVHFFVK